MKKIPFLLLAIMLVATSCKNHLHRNNAKMQIIATEHYPVVADYDFTKAFIKDENTEGRGVTVILGEEEFKEEEKMIEAFEKSNLIKLEEIPHREETTAWLMGTTVRTWTEVKISLTDEGKKYLLSETEDKYKVKLWETNFDAITGIKETGQGKMKVAKVDYIISNKNITPFGESFADKHKRTQKSIYFSLYDDGWKIDREAEE